MSGEDLLRMKGKVKEVFLPVNRIVELWSGKATGQDNKGRVYLAFSTVTPIRKDTPIFWIAFEDKEFVEKFIALMKVSIEQVYGREKMGGYIG